MGPVTQPLHRRIGLDTVYNLRDIGGYRTVDGRQTRWRLLFRSDSLHRLTPESQRALLAYGVRTIIDLRYREELVDSPSVFAQSSAVNYCPLALYQLDDPLVTAYQPQDLAQVYRMILELAQPQIRRIVGAIAAPGALPALVHCTAGKDRTGVIVALILGALGVPDETIVEDYALGASYLDPLLDELRAQAARSGYDTDWYNRLLESNPDTMRQMLSELRQRHGGPAEYLRAIGLPDQHILALRSALLE